MCQSEGFPGGIALSQGKGFSGLTLEYGERSLVSRRSMIELNRVGSVIISIA